MLALDNSAAVSLSDSSFFLAGDRGPPTAAAKWANVASASVSLSETRSTSVPNTALTPPSPSLACSIAALASPRHIADCSTRKVGRTACKKPSKSRDSTWPSGT